mmetsp:Transcript_56393/g.183204  ORF Transcript_56393/g.183204 Transcript_56393/m.183204 type:complete len:214 (-) Transcript_56393:653-1294(-)
MMWGWIASGSSRTSRAGTGASGRSAQELLARPLWQCSRWRGGRLGRWTGGPRSLTCRHRTRTSSEGWCRQFSDGTSATCYARTFFSWRVLSHCLRSPLERGRRWVMSSRCELWSDRDWRRLGTQIVASLPPFARFCGRGPCPSSRSGRSPTPFCMAPAGPQTPAPSALGASQGLARAARMMRTGCKKPSLVRASVATRMWKSARLCRCGRSQS